MNKVGGDGDRRGETLHCEEELDTEYGDAGSANGIDKDNGGGVGVRGMSTDGSLYGDPELADDDDDVNLAGDKRDVVIVKLDRVRDGAELCLDTQTLGEYAGCSCRDSLIGCRGECLTAGWLGESHANGRITLTHEKHQKSKIINNNNTNQ